MLYLKYRRQPVLSLFWIFCTRPTTVQIEMEVQESSTGFASGIYTEARNCATQIRQGHS
jgi:hypothetical protein